MEAPSITRFTSLIRRAGSVGWHWASHIIRAVGVVAYEQNPHYLPPLILDESEESCEEGEIIAIPSSEEEAPDDVWEKAFALSEDD